MIRRKWRRIRRTGGNYVCRNLPLILVGAVAQFVLTQYAYERRGHFAIGGEALVLPTILLLWEIVRMFLSSIAYVAQENARERAATHGSARNIAMIEVTANESNPETPARAYARTRRECKAGYD